MDPVGHGRFAAVAKDGHLKTQCDDVVFSEPIRSYFGHLMRINAHSHGSSAAIPIAGKRKSHDSQRFSLDIMGR